MGWGCGNPCRRGRNAGRPPCRDGESAYHGDGNRGDDPADRCADYGGPNPVAFPARCWLRTVADACVTSRRPVLRRCFIRLVLVGLTFIQRPSHNVLPARDTVGCMPAPAL